MHGGVRTDLHMLLLFAEAKCHHSQILSEVKITPKQFLVQGSLQLK